MSIRFKENLWFCELESAADTHSRDEIDVIPQSGGRDFEAKSMCLSHQVQSSPDCRRAEIEMSQVRNDCSLRARSALAQALWLC